MSDQPPIRKPFAKLLNWSGGRINLKKPAEATVKPAPANPKASFIEISVENPGATFSSSKRKADLQSVDVPADRTKKPKDEKEKPPAPQSTIPESLFSLPLITSDDSNSGFGSQTSAPSEKSTPAVPFETPVAHDEISAELEASKKELESKSNYIRKINRDYLSLQHQNDLLEEKLKEESAEREQLSSYSSRLQILYDSAVASSVVDEQKHKAELEVAAKERVALQAEVAALHSECAKLEALLETSQRSQSRLQDEVDALRFSNDTLVQAHNEQRGGYNKKLQEVYAEKAAMQQEHEADEVKWSELLVDTEKTQKQMMDALAASVQKVQRLETENKELKKRLLSKGSDVDDE